MKHTPGPWVVQEFKGWNRKDEYGNFTFPCMIATNYTVTKNSNYIFSTGSFGLFGRTMAEAEANAKLIAAAPDLLDALLDMVSDRENLSEATIENARKAIAKATTWT